IRRPAETIYFWFLNSKFSFSMADFFKFMGLGITSILILDANLGNACANCSFIKLVWQISKSNLLYPNLYINLYIRNCIPVNLLKIEVDSLPIKNFVLIIPK